MTQLVSGGRPPQTPPDRGDPSPRTLLGGDDPPEPPGAGLRPAGAESVLVGGQERIDGS